tara:strand:+ start:16405 stop:16884 length:480 start_codon:yes stop_codon:yes gene_type:complete
MAKSVKNKIRKKRKPMTPEQKAAAVERLAKARASKGPAEYKSIATSVVALPDDDLFSLKSIRGWIKTQKELLSSARKSLRLKAKGAESQVAIHEGYIRNMERYLRDGVWTDMFYGEYQEKKIKYRCVAPAYDKDGMVKRSHGVWYPDIGTVWVGQDLDG